jgi:hypothetical protein
MATNRLDSKEPKVFDVTQPGRSAPSSSSRPIIVTNRPMLRQDPMMVQPKEPSKDVVEQTTPVARSVRMVGRSPIDQSAPIIDVTTPKQLSPDAPLMSEDTSMSTAVDSRRAAMEVGQEALASLGSDGVLGESSAPKEELHDEEKATSIETKVSTEDVKGIKDPKLADRDAGNIERPPETTDSMPADDEISDNDNQLPPNQVLEEAKRKKEEEAVAQRAEQDKIIESKQYYLPIKADNHKRGTQRAMLVLLLVILLALVWFDMVLDAGIVHIAGIHSLTHFFKS